MTSCREVGPGDFVKIGKVWKEIEHNTAFGQTGKLRDWIVTTTDGENYGMYGINAYATAEEMKSWGPN